MADFTTNKINGDTVAASEWNQLADIDNAITTGGQTPATGDLNQLGKSMAAYAAQGGFFGTDSGAADAYVVTQISPFQAPPTLKTGLTVRFRPANANTGASTINVFGLGVKNIKQKDGSTDPVVGQISTTQDLEVRYDGTSFVINNEVNASTSASGIVELLTDAELATGTDTTRAATAASILSLFGASSQASSGYARLPINISGAFDELIIQWGVNTVAGNSTATITYPLTLPNGTLSVVASLDYATTALAGVGGGADTFTTTGFRLSNGITTTQTFYWISLGY